MLDKPSYAGKMCVYLEFIEKGFVYKSSCFFCYYEMQDCFSIAELHLSHATEVSVNNTENKLCLYANLMVNFSVTYEVGVNKVRNLYIYSYWNVFNLQASTSKPLENS